MPSAVHGAERATLCATLRCSARMARGAVREALPDAIFAAVAVLVWRTGLVYGNWHEPPFNLLGVLAWLPVVVLAGLSIPPLRRVALITPLFHKIKGILPRVSATEQEALNAGTIGFDAELFSGQPNWEKLRAVPPITLTEEEKARLIEIALNTPEAKEASEKYGVYRTGFRWLAIKNNESGGSDLWGFDYEMVDNIPENIPRDAEFYSQVEIYFGEPEQLLMRIAVDLDTEKAVRVDRYSLKILPK